MPTTRNTMLAAAMASLATLAAGCNILAWPMYVLAPPPPTDTVVAECNELRNSTVAVVIYTDMDTLHEFPSLREELGTAIAKALESKVEGVQAIHAKRVTRYQNANGHWATLPARQVATALGVQRVLYVTLTEFSTHARDNASMALGRVGAEVSIYGTEPTSPGTDPCMWRKTRLAHIERPTDPLQGVRDQKFRLATEKAFAEKLATCFYDHKVPRGQ